MYENGAQPTRKGVSLGPQLVDREAKKGFTLTPVDRLLYRPRYFTDSSVIGTKAFVARCSQQTRYKYLGRASDKVVSQCAPRPRCPVAFLPEAETYGWAARSEHGR